MTAEQIKFWHEGYVVFDDFFSQDIISKWRNNVMGLSEREPIPDSGIHRIKKKFDVANSNARDGAGEYDLFSIDGTAAFKFQSLPEYYESLTKFLSIFTGLEIVSSFDKKSAVTFMLYPPPAGQMLSHYDTQDISLLLYLTDNTDEGGTELYPVTSKRPTILGSPDEIIGDPVVIYPKSGRVVIFKGQQCWHRSLAVKNSVKISSAWNYYIKGNKWRPEEVNKRLYS